MYHQVVQLLTGGKFTLPEGHDAEKWILGFGESAELLEPDWLRKQLKDNISKVSRIYS